uniref:Uncharacterized protein n=1 Tax=Plectus sambesii TaxID=2011161 RepID=A0A914XT36_9BILA
MTRRQRSTIVGVGFESVYKDATNRCSPVESAAIGRRRTVDWSIRKQAGNGNRAASADCRAGHGGEDARRQIVRPPHCRRRRRRSNSGGKSVPNKTNALSWWL